MSTAVNVQTVPPGTSCHGGLMRGHRPTIWYDSVPANADQAFEEKRVIRSWNQVNAIELSAT